MTISHSVDECTKRDLDEDMNLPGPYHINCLDEWWKAAGCLEAGHASPLNNPHNVNVWNQMTKEEVKHNMTEYHNLGDRFSKNDEFLMLCYGRNTSCKLLFHNIIS